MRGDVGKTKSLRTLCIAFVSLQFYYIENFNGPFSFLSYGSFIYILFYSELPFSLVKSGFQSAVVKISTQD